MSITTKSTAQPSPQKMKRIWRVPTSKARWAWLGISIAFYAGIYAWYLYALKTQQFPGPFNDPLRLFGIISFAMVLVTATYTLRRRFARSLPGKVQDWLWLHTWVGIAAVLIAMLHENYTFILHDYSWTLSGFTDTYWAEGALFALIFLVLSGIIGRLLDMWQAHTIAKDADSNGIGIMRAIEERILELEYTVERLCAGKSEPFQQYCMQAFEHGGVLPSTVPQLPPREQADFQRAYDTLGIRARLVESLQRQKRARLIIRTWRAVHIVLAPLALLIISYHAVMELLTNVFHLIQAG
jgi:hypothetical protein